MLQDNKLDSGHLGLENSTQLIIIIDRYFKQLNLFSFYPIEHYKIG